MTDTQKANRGQITSARQLALYIDNYFKCNSCRLVRFDVNPTLFKPTSKVYKPYDIKVDGDPDAKKKIDDLPEKKYSTYCLACSMGRKITRIQKHNEKQEKKKPIPCLDQYRALVLNWVKTTGVTYTHNVLNDDCPVSIPTEIGMDVIEHKKLMLQLKELEEERDDLTSKVAEKNGEIKQLTSINHGLKNDLIDVRSELDDVKTNINEIPEQTQHYIQDLYNMIFIPNGTPRSTKSLNTNNFIQIKRGYFHTLLNTFSTLGAKLSKNQAHLVTS